MNDQSKLNNSILRVITFFDMFDYPLTALEVWRNVGVRTSVSGIEEAIRGLEKTEKIEESRGFYFLSGRKSIVETRMMRYNYANRKFVRAAWVSGILRYIPWVRMVAVGNVIGDHNLRDESDIDLFIITEKKRIWISRFFCVILMMLFRLRPRKGDEKDKICLSFFTSESFLDMEPLMLKGKEGSAGGTEDFYFIYWLAGLAVMYDADGSVYGDFMEKNSWIGKYLPNWRITDRVGLGIGQKGKISVFREIADVFLGGFEKYARSFQMRILPEEIRNLMNLDTRVVVNDEILKFHTNDRRKDYLKRFERRMATLIDAD